MKYIFLSFLFLQFAHAHEKIVKTKADIFAEADFEKARRHPWPFDPLSIGNNMQSYQNYGGKPYWHDGLDIRSEVDAPIHSSTGGKVVNIENYIDGNPLYWEIAILDEEGYVWKYHHIERKTIPSEIFKAFNEGFKISAGTYLGNVVRWPVTTLGEVYHHLHLLIVSKSGKYINPFLMLDVLDDVSVPVIKKIGIAKNHRPVQGNKVIGAHSLFIEAADLTLHQKYILPPHKISYRLDGLDEKLVWEFIHLPSGTNDLDYINDFYLDGSCGNYSCRKFFINLNFTQEHPRKTMVLDPGEHSVEVSIEDIAGNKTSSIFNWNVL